MSLIVVVERCGGPKEKKETTGYCDPGRVKGGQRYLREKRRKRPIRRRRVETLHLPGVPSQEPRGKRDVNERSTRKT